THTQNDSQPNISDGSISREGNVALRRALIELGIGLWLTDPAAKTYAAGLRARGKRGGIIACALAHRANRIAYALVRDQTSYQPTRWPPMEDSATLHNPGPRSDADRTKAPDQTPIRLWRTTVTPQLAWRPALRHHSSPNDAS
ncbi:MAG: hypothetical protein ACJ768_08590, partial [Gaiellaceae bacterium]